MAKSKAKFLKQLAKLDSMQAREDFFSDNAATVDTPSAAASKRVAGFKTSTSFTAERASLAKWMKGNPKQLKAMLGADAPSFNNTAEAKVFLDNPENRQNLQQAVQADLSQAKSPAKEIKGMDQKFATLQKMQRHVGAYGDFLEAKADFDAGKISGPQMQQVAEKTADAMGIKLSSKSINTADMIAKIDKKAPGIIAKDQNKLLGPSDKANIQQIDSQVNPKGFGAPALANSMKLNNYLKAYGNCAGAMADGKQPDQGDVDMLQKMGKDPIVRNMLQENSGKLKLPAGFEPTALPKLGAGGEIPRKNLVNMIQKTGKNIKLVTSFFSKLKGKTLPELEAIIAKPANPIGSMKMQSQYLSGQMAALRQALDVTMPTPEQIAAEEQQSKSEATPKGPEKPKEPSKPEQSKSGKAAKKTQQATQDKTAETPQATQNEGGQPEAKAPQAAEPAPKVPTPPPRTARTPPPMPTSPKPQKPGAAAKATSAFPEVPKTEPGAEQPEAKAPETKGPERPKLQRTAASNNLNVAADATAPQAAEPAAKTVKPLPKAPEPKAAKPLPKAPEAKGPQRPKLQRTQPGGKIEIASSKEIDQLIKDLGVDVPDSKVPQEADIKTKSEPKPSGLTGEPIPGMDLKTLFSPPPMPKREEPSADTNKANTKTTVAPKPGDELGKPEPLAPPPKLKAPPALPGASEKAAGPPPPGQGTPNSKTVAAETQKKAQQKVQDAQGPKQDQEQQLSSGPKR